MNKFIELTSILSTSLFIRAEEIKAFETSADGPFTLVHFCGRSVEVIEIPEEILSLINSE